MKQNLVSVVEAAYAIDQPTGVWLKALCRATRPWLDYGDGVFAALYDARDPRNLSMTEVTGTGISTAGMEAIRLGAAAAGPAIISQLRHETCGTLVDRLGARATRMPAMLAARALFGVRDVFGLNAQDPTQRGVVFAAPMRQRRELGAAFTRTWAHVAAHVASGFRLRRQVDEAVATQSEAVLDPDGKLLHAEGPATAKAARLALRGAAAAIDKARAGHGGDGDVRNWQALVHGRWSLVDSFERDGRRYVVAKKNDPFVPGQRLSLRERQVVGFAALGHSNKLIAWELGVSTSTVATQLSSAMKKLGISSRVQLIATFEQLTL